jgi:rhodanese-related sulfurtransferase
MNLETLMKNGEGTKVDVLTRKEFMGGHVTGSINIPIQELMQKIDDLKEMKSPLILCCASGGRSW